MVDMKKIWVKEIHRSWGDGIRRYTINKTLNIYPANECRVGQILQEYELRNYIDRWEVEIS